MRKQINIVPEPVTEYEIVVRETSHVVPIALLTKAYEDWRTERIDLSEFAAHTGLTDLDEGELIQVVRRFSDDLPELIEAQKKYDAAVGRPDGDTSSQADSDQTNTTP